MLTSNMDPPEAGSGDVLIPLIRAAATIGFAIAPYSLGFVIIAVSEQLIRSIMVGEDPEMLVSDLQNQFPNDAIAIDDDDQPGLVAKVVELIEQRPGEASQLPVDIRVADLRNAEWGAFQDLRRWAPESVNGKTS
jgi:AraC family transcriptional regulator, regulatory protein of adaptative response / methylated-DNA-[protein]-cysteine methyltransferase